MFHRAWKPFVPFRLLLLQAHAQRHIDNLADCRSAATVASDQGDGDGNAQERGVRWIVHVQPPVAYWRADAVGVRPHYPAVLVRLGAPGSRKSDPWAHR